MKRTLFLLLFGLASALLFAQDVIVKRNGDQIKSKILEITAESIKYKDFDFQDGPIRNIKISDVAIILYENGKRESFTQPQNQAVSQVSREEVSAEKETPRNTYKGNYFMLGSGFGNSYGIVGYKAQARFGGKVGFGFHCGIGFIPDEDQIAFSAGLKFFPYKGLYLNTQMGALRYRDYFSASGFSYDETDWEFCPSFLVGIDQVWGRKVGIGFNAALGFNIPTDMGDPAL